MKIWVIGRGYPTPANKMWGSFELEQAKLLARDGNDVSYIALTLSFFSRKDPRGQRFFTEDNVKVYADSRLYFPGKLGIYWEQYEDKCWQRLFMQAEKNGLPDLIHVHYPAMISSINEVEKYRKKGVKIYVTEHWSRVLINNLKKHELARLQYYAAHAECFASVGKPLQQSVQRLADAKVPMTIIPNIVSPVYFQTQKQTKRTGFTFICVGRLVPVKRFDAVIRQFRKKFPDQTDIKLIIVGSGSEKTDLMQKAQGDSRIRFTGEIRADQLSELIAESDALVSFSRYETFAAPVAEAWASGKPAIVSNTSGIASYVNEDLGLVVPADSEDALGQNMIEIYQQYSKYDSDRIKKFAMDHFSDKAILEKLRKMYSENK